MSKSMPANRMTRAGVEPAAFGLKERSRAPSPRRTSPTAALFPVTVRVTVPVPATVTVPAPATRGTGTP